MRDRTYALILGILALIAFLLFWAWDSDAWLKYQCRAAHGRWDAAERICTISAAKIPS